MEINKLEYSDESIKYLKQKLILYFVFLCLFTALFVTSLTVMIMLFVKDVKEVLTYFVVVFQLLGNGLYVFASFATIKQTRGLISRINAEHKFEVILNMPIKVDYNKNITSMALIYFICAGVIFLATIGSIVMLCLTFSISMLAEVLFMVLILCFAVLIAIATTIDDVRIKVELVSSKIKQENKEDATE